MTSSDPDSGEITRPDGIVRPPPGMVHHLEERLIVPGVDRRIVDFFLWWDEHGSFPLTIPPTGGVRTDEAVQAALYAQGRTSPGPRAGEDGFPALGLTVTNARTLADTPHGRAAAADALPAVVKNGVVVAVLVDDRDTKVRLMFEAYGLLAEQHGLEWGGRFKGKDRPHVQCPNWRSLPMPQRSNNA